MSAPPTAFNSGDPVNIGFGGDTVTLVEGATFCLSDRRGDVLAGRSHGLFVRDARVLSRWELQVDGQPPSRCRCRPRNRLWRNSFCVVPRAPDWPTARCWWSGSGSSPTGLRETISLHNLDDESTVVALMLHADADFADLFSVKEGRAPLGGADLTVLDHELVLTDRTDRIRGVTVTASGDPIVLPGFVELADRGPAAAVLAGRDRRPADVGKSERDDAGSAAASTRRRATRLA